MEVVSTDSYSYGIACVRCNYTMIAPNWSEYVTEHHVRHSWSCESCGNQFETLDDVQGSTSAKTGRKIPSRMKGKSQYKNSKPRFKCRGSFHATPVVGGLGVDQRDITSIT